MPFTPGPWTSAEDQLTIVRGLITPSDVDCYHIEAQDGDSIAYSHRATGKYAATYEANAHLIAAAPDLYEALAQVQVTDNCWCQPWDTTDWRYMGSASDPDGHSPTCRLCRTALAKARGE